MTLTSVLLLSPPFGGGGPAVKRLVKLELYAEPETKMSLGAKRKETITLGAPPKYEE